MSASPSPARAAVAPVLAIPNGAARPVDAIPYQDRAELRRWIVGATAHGRRVSALFAAPYRDQIALIAILAHDEDGTLELARTDLTDDGFVSVTATCPQVHLFEREIAEQWSVTPAGHPWLKPVRFPPSRGRPVGVTDFYAIEGGDVHEVAVGPVHAGVIEPGHFRFQCYGETVLHLEISLGYQHRGIERAMVRGATPRRIHYAETIAGDTTIGHATAHCETIEALARCPAPARALGVRAIALELERLANHVGDLGALAGDVGFLPTASFCGRLRGEYLNITADLCGNRFGRGLVRPGGVRYDVDDDLAANLLRRLETALHETDEAARLLWESGSVQSRFEEVGTLSTEHATELGAVGPVARASGLHRDVRFTHPSGYFRFAHVPISAMSSGDVFARAYVRYLEIKRSVELIARELPRLPRGDRIRSLTATARDHIAVSLVEGWRGEICHVAITDADGRLAAYKIVDPSFHNWGALAMALRGQQISDFPLCNKSFNLSYCGHDL